MIYGVWAHFHFRRRLKSSFPFTGRRVLWSRQQAQNEHSRQKRVATYLTDQVFEASPKCLSVRTPLLSRGGVAAPVTKYREASSAGADGVVLVNHRLFAGPTPPRPLHQKVASRYFFEVASTPPRLRRGVRRLDITQSRSVKYVVTLSRRGLSS